MRTPVKQLVKHGMRLMCRGLSCFNRKPRPAAPERILLVAGGYLGDTFWALQVIPLLKKAFPEAEIHVAGRPFIHELANTVLPEKNLHNVFIVSDRSREKVDWNALKQAASGLRRDVQPDLVIDLMCNRYSAWFCFMLRAYTVGMDLAEEVSPLYSFCAKQNLIPQVYLAQRPYSIVRQFLGLPDSADIVMIPPVPKMSKSGIFAKYGIGADEKTAMLIPGAGWAAKRWEPEKFHLLAGRLAGKGFRILVSGSPSEKKLCSAIALDISGAIVLCGSLADTVSMLPHCSFVVGNDTGTTHLAEAFHVPTVSMYCATNHLFSCEKKDYSSVLVSKCPLSPSAKDPYCKIHAIRCSRPEWMQISVEQVANKLFREG